MKTLNALGYLGLALVLPLGLAACGQKYVPEPDAHIAGPHGGPFGSTTDQAPYKTVDATFLESTITDVLGVTPMTMDAACTAADACPKTDPIAYLDANKSALGEAVYGDAGSQAPTPITSGGIKVWIQAASSACGLMMMQQSPPSMFPAGIADYSTLYVTLLGRAPTPAEITSLDALRAEPILNTDAKRGAAVCSTVLGSLEFLQAN